MCVRALQRVPWRATRSRCLRQSDPSSVPRAPPLTCSQHNRPVEVYCVQDELPVCMLCTATDHHGHRCLSLEDACKQQADVLRGGLSEARAKASAAAPTASAR